MFTLVSKFTFTPVKMPTWARKSPKGGCYVRLCMKRQSRDLRIRFQGHFLVHPANEALRQWGVLNKILYGEAPARGPTPKTAVNALRL